MSKGSKNGQLILKMRYGGRTQRRLSALCGILAVAFVSLFSTQGANPSEVSMPAIFGDNMVLQCDAKVPVWGRALPGDSVLVKFKGQEKSTVADAIGNWSVRLDPMPVSVEPSILSVISNSGQKDFQNVLVGEVWLCSGQSNMQATSKMLGIPEEIQNAENSQFRLFTAPRSGVGQWSECTTEGARAFSATAYHFARSLWHDLQVPVGVIVASEGSSSIETWIPPEEILANDFLVDQNGAKLVDEMRKFDQFFAKFDQLPAQEKERVFLEHCKSKYEFARSFLQADGTLKPGQDGSILWHMSVIKPAFTFTKFIAQILPYAIKGVLWYQGETNALGDGDPQYAQKQQILIEGWRKLWDDQKLPFVLVQIPPCQSYPWLANFWLQQYEAVKNTPGTFLIPTVDLGVITDSHPKNKSALGSRIASLVVKDVYGKRKTFASGPSYKAWETKGSTIEISFENTDGGLATSDGGPPKWFEVAGSDGRFHKAEAVVVEDKVVLTSPVKDPTYVRYAWSYLAVPNLGNKEGFAAFPFNTAENFFQSSPKDKVSSP